MKQVRKQPPPHLNPLPRRGEETGIPSPRLRGEGQGEGNAVKIFFALSLAFFTIAATTGPSTEPDPALHKDAPPIRQRDPARAALYQGRGIALVNAGKYE